MIRRALTVTGFAALMAGLSVGPGAAQQVQNAPMGQVRVLDKITGAVRDVDIPEGGQARMGLLDIRMDECRYPAGNPNGNAYALLTVFYRGLEEPVFKGWMIASSPALNPMDHPRYDVWVLRCKTS